ncbi:MAG: hypothetical protein M1469_00255 [Bacteroidetes bacterium]|nr:hypothetical protein [Bacteroidota bacterium]
MQNRLVDQPEPDAENSDGKPLDIVICVSSGMTNRGYSYQDREGMMELVVEHVNTKAACKPGRVHRIYFTIS